MYLSLSYKAAAHWMLCMVAMDTLAVVRFLLYLRLVIETAIGSSNFFCVILVTNLMLFILTSM